MRLKKVFIFAAALFAATSVFARTDYDKVLWDDYITLRDAVYNSEAPAGELTALYDAARQSAKELFKDDSLYIAFSRCEYMMGRAYSYEENKEMAAKHYDAGELYVNQALDIKETASALIMYGENVSQNCSVKPVSYAITMGTKVGGFASDVLKLDPDNGAALYMKNAQYIYAPSPFHNYGKGIKKMKELFDDPNIDFEKDDLFNVTSAIGYGYMGKKEYDDARGWFNKALEYYPNNAFVNGLLKDIEGK